MLVLGVVRTTGQAHGYQVRRELLAWRADTWAKIAPGSIYQALRTLTKRGMLEQLSTEAGSRGPERTVYRITDAGEGEFWFLVRAAVSDADTENEALNAAFAFLHLMGRSEVITLLGYRLRGLRGSLALLEQPGDISWAAETPDQVKALVELRAGQLTVEMDWTRDLVEQLRAGMYRFADYQDTTD